MLNIQNTHLLLPSVIKYVVLSIIERVILNVCFVFVFYNNNIFNCFYIMRIDLKTREFFVL